MSEERLQMQSADFKRSYAEQKNYIKKYVLQHILKVLLFAFGIGEKLVAGRD